MMKRSRRLGGVDEQHAVAPFRSEQRDQRRGDGCSDTALAAGNKEDGCHPTSHVAILLSLMYGGSSASETTGRFGRTGSMSRRRPTRSDGGASSGTGRPST